MAVLPFAAPAVTGVVFWGMSLGFVADFACAAGISAMYREQRLGRANLLVFDRARTEQGY